LKLRIGTLTGGGDTAALDATLKGVALGCEEYGYKLIGFIEGWWGVLNNEYVSLSSNMIDENRGGSIIKCSRTNLLKVSCCFDNHSESSVETTKKVKCGINKAISNLCELQINGLVPIGGDDTLTVGSKLNDEGFPVNCVTKTVDNDVGINAPKGEEIDFTKMVNYFCPGFPTAAKRVADYVRDLRTTAYSHNRIVVVEVMGRYYSWLALAAAYGLPDFILAAEIGLNYPELVEKMRQRYLDRGNVIIIVPEGLKDENGKEITLEGFYTKDEFDQQKLGGVGDVLAARLKKTLASELEQMRSEYCHGERISYWQRAGSPIEIDREMAKALGQKAVEGIKDGNLNQVSCVMRTEEGVLEPTLLPLDKALLRDDEGRVIPRELDLRFYDEENYCITPAGIEYFRPILGVMPKPYQCPELKIKTI